LRSRWQRLRYWKEKVSAVENLFRMLPPPQTAPLHPVFTGNRVFPVLLAWLLVASIVAMAVPAHTAADKRSKASPPSSIKPKGGIDTGKTTQQSATRSTPVKPTTLQESADTAFKHPLLNEPLLWVERNDKEETDPAFLARIMDEARSGNPLAVASLGLLFEKLGDFDRAREWYSRAMDSGHVGATERLAWMHWMGRGSPRNPLEATALANRAAPRGAAWAQYILGLAYLRGDGRPADPTKARYWLGEAMQREHRMAAAELGALYRAGIGGPVDRPGARRAFELGAELGLPEALWGLYQMAREDGNEAEAGKALTRAAELGHPLAQLDLGCALAVAPDGVKDMTLAYQWLERAANQEVGLAQALLAGLLETGSGTMQNESAAEKWRTRSMRTLRFDAAGLCDVGSCYLEARVVSKDLKRAFGYFLRAAELGSPIAQNNVGYWLSVGIETRRDPIEGYKWLWLAARQDEPRATANLQAAIAQLTPTELAEGTRRAMDFVPAKPITASRVAGWLGRVVSRLLSVVTNIP
jgi:TPR repeat protein